MHYTSREVYEFVSQQTKDPIVERKTCSVSWTAFAVYQSDIHMLKKLSPTIWGKTHELPTPTYCPEIRRLIRLSFINERNLYKTSCSLSWESILSQFHPDIWLEIYWISAYLSDSRSDTTYWKTFQATRPFFQQYSELIQSTPKLSQTMSIRNLQSNSKYVNYAADLKDCYLVFDTDNNENCQYSTKINHSSDCFDCYNTLHSQLCYECIDSSHLYSCKYTQSSNDCNNSIFLYNCINCEYCICCTNLTWKSYYFNNAHIWKEEYQKRIIEIEKRWLVQKYEKIFNELLSCTERFPLHNTNSSWCIWNWLHNCHNTNFSFNISESSDIKYSQRIHNATDVMDVFSFWSASQKLYYSTSVWRSSSNLTFCVNNYKAHYNLYCYETRKNSFAFWCANFEKKDNWIFNKVYSKKEYERITTQIIWHMKETNERWKFFPTTLSPFPLNDTLASDFFPVRSITKNWITSVINQEWSWNVTLLEPNKSISKATLDLWWTELLQIHRKIQEKLIKIPPSLTPVDPKIIQKENRISLIDKESLSREIILWEKTSKPYRINPAEIEYYKKQSIQVPSKHPDTRHSDRLKKRSPLELHIRRNQSWERTISVYSQESWIPLTE